MFALVFDTKCLMSLQQLSKCSCLNISSHTYIACPRSTYSTCSMKCQTSKCQNVNINIMRCIRYPLIPLKYPGFRGSSITIHLCSGCDGIRNTRGSIYLNFPINVRNIVFIITYLHLISDICLKSWKSFEVHARDMTICGCKCCFCVILILHVDLL